jgi:hypothetical protein
MSIHYDKKRDGISVSAAEGVVLQIIAKGAMDGKVHAETDNTFWRFGFSKHTNFAMEASSQRFVTEAAFGASTHSVIGRDGDLAYWAYVVADMPGLVATKEGSAFGGPTFPAYNGATGSASAPCADDEASSDFAEINASGAPWCHYTNAVGQRLIKRAWISVGGHPIQTLYSDFMFAWEELTGKAGKRLEEMIGKRDKRSALIADASRPQRLYIPLPFWFTCASGNALPLCALQFHGVQIDVEFEAVEKLVVVSEPGVRVNKLDGSPLTSRDLRAHLEISYVYLDMEERNKFVANNFDQMIRQVQVQAVTQRSTSITMNVPFNHPVVELILMVRRKRNEECNNWFDFSGVNGMDPVEHMALRINNLNRFAGREGRYYRLVQPYQHHTNIPRYHIYVYSFALYPEDPQPSGSCNFSRIDNIELQVDLQEELAEEYCTAILFAPNQNLFRVTDGLGGVKYTA